MEQQKICIIGDGLAGLITAIILSKQNLKIELYSSPKKKSKNLDNRTTAISESNFQFIKNNLNFKKKSLLWPCRDINLFFEEENKITNFLNFNEKNKNSMYVFQNKFLKEKLIQMVKIKKNIKVIKKNVDEINSEVGYLTIENKKRLYDLIILCIGGQSQLYNKIEAGRSIKKNYEEVAITAIIKHNVKIINASQFFLKEGPLAILPFHKNIFSVVWSISRRYFEENKKNLKQILTQRLLKILNIEKISKLNSMQFYPIHLNLKTRYFKKNILILGDGLHTVHPMAGQGFNLVLRDIKKLADLTLKTSKLGLLFKNSQLLKDFYNSRKPENNLFGLGINLTNLFFKDNKNFYAFKKKILNNINNFDFIKKISRSVADKGILF